MRYKLLVASLAVIFTCTPAAADGSISGVVVAMEPASGKLILRQDGTGRLVTVNLEKGRLDGAIAPGSQVTAGGRFRPGSTEVFDARKIKPGRSKQFGIDPTGVRKRLYKNSLRE